MFCPKCGKELKGTPKFCTYCGAAIAEWSSGASTQAPPVQKQPAYQNQPMYQNQTQMNRQPLLSEKAEYEKGQESLNEPEIPYSGNSPRGNGPKKILLAVAGVAAAACVAGGSMAAGKWYASKKNASSESETSLASDETQISETSADGETISAEEESAIEAAALSDSDLAKKIAKYNTGSAAGQELMIDVFAENYTPGARDTNYAWDKTLFYTLEDVDPNSANDGRINGYSISKKMMKNAATGNKMEYEIYTNPENNKVNKIVSIEYFSDHLEITDYYYDDAGKVSFIFVRNDINYVPSYAVPTKDGQRYYFYNDCMTKWRVVSGGVQTNYVIGQKSAQQGTNPAGSVHLYSSLDAQQQANYDTMEKRMINAAYNTYNIVLAAEGLSEITGYVYNEDGTPLPDADVLLTDGNNQENLFKAKTDSNGLYQIAVPSDEYSYTIRVSYDSCVSVNIFGIVVSGQTLSDYQNPVYMVKSSESAFSVNLRLFDALNYAANGQGMERLSNATVYIRKGINNKNGSADAQGTADGEGIFSVNLDPGMYTAEVAKSGYDNTYYNFAVRPGMNDVQINASPKLASGEVRIVLTWGETPYDLDSHLFTPYDSAFGDDTYHIWYGNKQDAVGNNLDVDDTDSYGPETMTIPVLKNGLYKYYVADFTDCSGNNPSSYDMSNSGAVVNVYTSNGLSATFTVPTNRPGVIWEVFEIRNGVIVPNQRYYSNIEDKTWWHSDK